MVALAFILIDVAGQDFGIAEASAIVDRGWLLRNESHGDKVKQ